MSDMQRLLSISFITLALVVSAAGVAPTVHAGPLPEGNACPQGSFWISERDRCEYDEFSPVVLVTEDEAVAQETAATAARIAADKAANLTAMDPGQAPKLDGAMAQIMSFIMSLFAWLLGVAMITLNYAVYYTVVTMGNYVHNLAAVGVAWSILRDIGNIMLIFGFLAVGVTTILNVDWYGGGKKMLPMMLVAAVFLNFSLFISEAVIDTGNLFATQFYTQINGGKLPTPADVNSMSPASEGISNKIMSQLGLATIYASARQNDKVLLDGTSVFIAFMSIILFMIAAFVMFSLAFVLVFRFVALLFLIILSPVGFAGLAVPQLARRAKQWWDKLFEQTVTAPILLLMLYIALAIITDVHFLGFGPAGDWAGFVPNASGGITKLANFGSILLSFLVAMGLLLAVVIQSKNLSAFGAKLAQRAAGALSFGAVSLGGRATLGLAGGMLASKRMQALARMGSKPGSSRAARAGGLALRAAVFGGRGLRGATYDVRNFPGATTGLGAIGVNAGKGATFTARQAIESLDAQYGLKPIRKFFEESAQEREQAGREMDFKDAQADLAAGRITQDQFDAIATPILSKMTTKQLEELSGIRKGTEALVRNLSPEQFEALMNSDKFNEIEKGKMRENRYSSLRGAITAGNRDAVRQWSAKDLATAVPDILNNPVQAASFINLMSEGQFDAVVKNDKLSKSQQQQLRDFSTQGKISNYLDISNGRAPRTPALVTAGIIPVGMAPAAAATEATRLMGTMNPKKLAKLHGSILTDPLTMSLLTPKHLAAFMTDGDLDPVQIHTIATAVRNPAHPNHAAFVTYLNSTTNPIADSYWA